MNSNIALVSYYNTLPFLHGLKKHGQFTDWNIILRPPSGCLESFKSGEVDIALVPVGALSQIENYNIVTDYCIGCNAEVFTVGIYANQPIEKINKIYLDQDSRTSVLLGKILMDEYFKIKPIFIQNLPASFPEIGDNEAVLMIGDKVFRNHSRFTYTYDLGKYWWQYTGLPFVFAVWVARKNVAGEIVSQLNNALSNGMTMIDDIIARHNDPSIDLVTYYQKYISFDLTADKKRGMKLYLDKSSRY